MFTAWKMNGMNVSFVPVRSIKLVAMLLAQLGDARHVDFVNRVTCAEVRRDMTMCSAIFLRITLICSTRSPSLLVSVAGGAERFRQLERRWSCGSDGVALVQAWLTRFDETQDVVLGDAAAHTGAFESCNVDAVLLSNLADQRTRLGAA